ncbi:hypothetical protein EDC04DRAFT_2600297 [Pisolithus marmoratus]|nr:hypothetical protein EDC04DRAFT_2600297 [Pisolithus marmoratus]
MITPDTHHPSQSSLDIGTPKQFTAVLQNVFRSIDVNPDDVDYGICRRGFQYISGANYVKEMEVQYMVMQTVVWEGMGEVDAMLNKVISMFKDSIILFFEWLGDSFETGEIDEAIGPLKIAWTDCLGRLTGGMKDTAYNRYQCWLQKYVLLRHKWKPSIVLLDMPTSSRPRLDARGGNLTQTTRMNTHLAALASMTATPSHSSSSSPSSSEVLSPSDMSSAADDAIYGTRDV